MHLPVAADRHGAPSSLHEEFRLRDLVWSLLAADADGPRPMPAAARLPVQIAIVFLAYYIAGEIGQATTKIRSSNLGPVWPASGVALAAFLAYGPRVWPGIAGSAFIVALSSPVPPLAAIGQAVGVIAASLTGARLLRRIPGFHPSLSRLRDALGLIVLAAFGSTILSASIGVSSLYAAGVQAYSGLASAWLIYWLGDSTGVLLITPLIFSFPSLVRLRSRAAIVECAALFTLLIATCFVVFGDLPLIPIRLHVLAFAVLPFVMWAAIDFGVGGASLSVVLISVIATVATALGFGPFAESSSFINGVLLDVLFIVLSVSGLTLAAVIAEREKANSAREQLIREQAAVETRLRLAAVVESSNDAILSKDLDGIILTWNAAAERTFGFSEAEVVGRTAAMILPPDRADEDDRLSQRFRAGERIDRYKTIRRTKAGNTIDVSLTITPIADSAGKVVGVAEIARDITEQQRAEEALSSVSRRLIHAQEQERARIARELHDDFGQRLALLAIGLSQLSSGSGVPHGSQTDNLRHQALEIGTDIQNLAHQLHSSKLEILGIVSAMKNFCDEFASLEQVEIQFVHRDVPDQVPSDVSFCLFRILQEALRNSAKHSGAERFEVQLWGGEDEIHLVVSDSGAGFDVERAKAGRGLGLVSMDERLKLVNGYLTIKAQPRGGTRIHARVPLPPVSD